MNWNSYMLDLGHTKLRVAERGSSLGTPLLLLNGIGAHVDMWEPFARLLGDRHVIACDLPGCGESPRLRYPRRMGGLANLIDELLTELGHEQVDLLGISFGGALAQVVANREPERIRRLVLCATSAGFVCAPPRPLAGLFLMTPARYMHPLLFKLMMPQIVGGKTARDPSALVGQMDNRLSHPPDTVGYAYQLYAASGWTSAHFLCKISQPTLILAGEDDRAIPLPNARLLKRLIPDSQLHVVADGGHAFLLDEPESVVDQIDAFLDAA